MNKKVLKRISPIIVVAMLGTAALIYFVLISSNDKVVAKQSLTPLYGTLADIGCKKNRKVHSLKTVESTVWLSFGVEGIDCSDAKKDWTLGLPVQILFHGRLEQEPVIYDLNIGGRPIFNYKDSVNAGYEVQKNLLYFVLLQWFFVVGMYVKGVFDSRKLI
mgnify:FL=1|jgi:hypothetical protein